MQPLSARTAGSVTLGADLRVNRIGLGTNRITQTRQARELLERAIALEIDFIDTADVYREGESEATIGNVLAPFPPGLVVATKGGMIRGAPPKGTPEYLRSALEWSLKRLKTDRIDLYQLHRIDPTTPLDATIGFLKQAQEEGKIRHIGLSNVNIEQIEAARRVAPIVSVQNKYNIGDRESEEVLDYCEKEGIVFIPWFPLSRGNFGELEHVLSEMAGKYRASIQQIAINWLLKRSPVMLPIPGTLSIGHLEENVAAAGVQLSNEDFKMLSMAGLGEKYT